MRKIQKKIYMKAAIRDVFDTARPHHNREVFKKDYFFKKKVYMKDATRVVSDTARSHLNRRAIFHPHSSRVVAYGAAVQQDAAFMICS